MKTIEEDILCMLGALNAISRRGANPPPPPPPSALQNGTPHEPMPPRGHGRGRMLDLLLDNGEMSQSQLAAMLCIRPQSLSELLVKAEADDLIIRQTSPDDKRQTIVSLSENGRNSVKAFREAHKKHAAEFLSSLSEEEKTALADILRKLINANRDDHHIPRERPE